MKKRRYMKLAAWVLCAMMIALQATTGFAALARPGESVLKDQSATNTVGGIGQKTTEAAEEPEEEPAEEAPAASGNTVGGIGKKKNNTVSGLGQKKEESAASSDTSGSLKAGNTQKSASPEDESGTWIVEAVNLTAAGYTLEEWYATEKTREMCALILIADCQTIETESVRKIVTAALEENNIYLCTMTSDPDKVYMIMVTTSGTLAMADIGEGEEMCVVNAQTYTKEQVAAYNIQTQVDNGSMTKYYKVDSMNVLALMAEFIGSQNQ